MNARPEPVWLYRARKCVHMSQPTLLAVRLLVGICLGTILSMLF